MERMIPSFPLAKRQECYYTSHLCEGRLLFSILVVERVYDVFNNVNDGRNAFSQKDDGIYIYIYRDMYVCIYICVYIYTDTVIATAKRRILASDRPSKVGLKPSYPNLGPPDMPSCILQQIRPRLRDATCFKVPLVGLAAGGCFAKPAPTRGALAWPSFQGPKWEGPERSVDASQTNGS